MFSISSADMTPTSLSSRGSNSGLSQQTLSNEKESQDRALPTLVESVIGLEKLRKLVSSATSPITSSLEIIDSLINNLLMTQKPFTYSEMVELKALVNDPEKLKALVNDPEKLKALERSETDPKIRRLFTEKIEPLLSCMTECNNAIELQKSVEKKSNYWGKVLLGAFVVGIVAYIVKGIVLFAMPLIVVASSVMITCYTIYIGLLGVLAVFTIYWTLKLAQQQQEVCRQRKMLVITQRTLLD